MPGRFIVGFKSEAQLANVPKSGRYAPEVLPTLHPTSRRTIQQLAAALAARVNGTVGHLYSNSSPNGFSLSGVSDEDAKKVLAKDPRIEFIEAEIQFKLDMH